MKLDIVLVSLYLGNFISNSGNSLISPFFPQIASKLGIGDDVVGLIFSMHPVGAFFASMIVGKAMSSNKKRKQFMIIGIFLEAMSLILFGIVKFIPQNFFFIFTSLVARLMLGIGQSLFLTPAFSLLPMMYGNQLEETVAYMQAVTGLGLMAGPMLGSAFYALGGYVLPFIVFMGALLCLIPILIKYIPNQRTSSHYNSFFVQSRNSQALTDSSEEGILLNQSQNSEIQVSYQFVFGSKKICLTYIIIMFPTIGLMFLQTTLSNYLDQQYELTPIFIGLVFSIGTVMYILMAPLGSYLTRRISNYQTLIFYGSLITGITFFFFGPDDWTGLPQSLWIICIADAIQQSANVFLFIPAIPEFLILLQEKLPHHTDDTIGDLASTIYNSAQAMGGFIGPLLGGLLSQNFGFPRSATVFGLIIIIFTLLYLAFSGQDIVQISFKKLEIPDQIVQIKADVLKEDNGIQSDKPIQIVEYQLSSLNLDKLPNDENSNSN